MLVWWPDSRPGHTTVLGDGAVLVLLCQSGLSLDAAVAWLDRVDQQGIRKWPLCGDMWIWRLHEEVR